MEKLNAVIPGMVSDDLYEMSIGLLNRSPNIYGSKYAKTIVHLIDSVSRGYTTPMEAYDAINATYIPIWVYARRSAYEHTI